MTTPDPVDLLRDASNSHDPQRVADCFTADHRSEVPHRPTEGSVGSDRDAEARTAILTPPAHPGQTIGLPLAVRFASTYGWTTSQCSTMRPFSKRKMSTIAASPSGIHPLTRLCAMT